jgi:hypothetical protein
MQPLAANVVIVTSDIQWRLAFDLMRPPSMPM